MNPSNTKIQLNEFRKFLLSRLTVATQITEYIENCLIADNEDARHTFHKIMVHNWVHTNEELFETLSQQTQTTVIPVQFNCNGGVASFYTNSLNLILRLIKLDFMFPFKFNMYNVDILFNDRSSLDCFGQSLSLEDIVGSIVSNRFKDTFELDLSDFCNDTGFANRRITFYKLSLLASFKILMIRMGKDTTQLNLSNNSLTQIPVEIMNFFIKGDLIGVNLSNNNIMNLSDLMRMTSKIEKLWLEGNPMCDDIDPMSYVKQIAVKFPRLKELDGIPLNRHGILFPLWRNYIGCSDKRTKMFVEKFVSLFFQHYDRPNRSPLKAFYHKNATFTLSCYFDSPSEAEHVTHYSKVSRNLADSTKRSYMMANKKIYTYNVDAMIAAFTPFPPTTHDPTTFCVDAVRIDRNSLMVTVDGIFKEKNFRIPSKPDIVFQFRRTFVFKLEPKPHCVEYYITNEMLHVRFALQEMISNSFKEPILNMNSVALVEPEKSDTEAICTIFQTITHLKRLEVELRLVANKWDIAKALQAFSIEIERNEIPPDRFVNDDGSDSSTFGDDYLD